MNSLVSVIVPVYNKEDVLSRCLNSIKNQSYTYFEVLLVNDGSKDKSLPILKQYESNDDRFHVVDKVNGGASSARNVGLDYARGEYICFVDPDDYIESNYIERLYNAIQQADMAVCGYNRIYGDRNVTLEKQKDYKVSKELFLKKILLSENPGSGYCWNKIFKKTLVNDIRFDESIHYGEDAAFLYEIIKNNVLNSIYVCNEGLYNYVLNDNGLSRTLDENKLSGECKIAYKYLEYTRRNYPNDFAFAVKRYLDPFSLLIIYCDDLNVYKKGLIEAKNLVSHLKKIEGVSKIKLFLIGFKIKYARFSRFIFRKKYGLR